MKEHTAEFADDDGNHIRVSVDEYATFIWRATSGGIRSMIRLEHKDAVQVAEAILDLDRERRNEQE